MNSHQRRKARRAQERQRRRFAQAAELLKRIYADRVPTLLEPSPLERLGARSMGQGPSFMVPHRKLVLE